MIRPGVYSRAVRIAASPIGPAPTIATVSPGRDLAVEDADLVGGREDVGEEQDLLVAQLRPAPCRARCRRTGSARLGLDAVDGVAEDPAAAADALAVVALLAEAAAPARADAGDEHAVARRPRVVTPAPVSTTMPTASWPRIVPGVDLGHVALEDVQVGAADRRAVDPDDRVGRRRDPRSGTVSQAFWPGP